MSFFQIEKHPTAVLDTVLTNVVKMLTARKLLDENNLESNVKKITSIKNDDNLFTIVLDTLYGTSKQKNFLVKYIPYKIAGINKSYGAQEFLNMYKENAKILIVKEIGGKVGQQIAKNYPNTEIFLEEDLMINIIDHEIIPTHEVLSPEETETFFQKFNVTKKGMPKMFTTDPIAKYYNMPVGAICRIIRPSERSGEYVTYRIVK